MGRLSNRVVPSRSSRASVQHDTVVQFCFVSKMVVHRGHIDFGALGDSANGGALKSVFGEDFARGIKDFIAGVFFAQLRRFDARASLFGGHTSVLNKCLKQSSETVV